jgi:hypothetical protein
LKSNGIIRQLLAYADDISILGENTNNIKGDTGALLQASREVGLEASTQKTKYMVMSRHQNARQNNLMTAYNSFENVIKFRYLEQQ